MGRGVLESSRRLRDEYTPDRGGSLTVLRCFLADFCIALRGWMVWRWQVAFFLSRNREEILVMWGRDGRMERMVWRRQGTAGYLYGVGRSNW
jgi:hypothetical protein